MVTRYPMDSGCAKFGVTPGGGGASPTMAELGAIAGCTMLEKRSEENSKIEVARLDVGRLS
jgi:hypothetical protein